MMCPRYGFLCLVLLANIASALASTDADVLDQANSAVRTGDLDRAEMILKGYFESGGHDPEARFLYARVLAWQGEYDRAIEQFSSLLQAEPDNADYLLARGNAYEWSGQREPALRDLRKARQVSPEYKEVWRTEIKYLSRSSDPESIKQAKNLVELAETRFPEDDWRQLVAGPATSPVNTYSAEAGIRYDHLTNGRPPWRALMARLDMQTTTGHFAHVKYDATERFDLNDHQVGAGYALPFAESWMIYAAGTYSPTHRVLANRSVELRLTKSFRNGFSLHGGAIHARYNQTSSQQALLTGEYYWDNYRFAYTYRLVDVLNAGTGSNSSIQFNRYFTAGSYVALALGAGEDVEFDGTATPPISDVVSFSVFGRYLFRPRWSLVYSYNYHEQGDLYNRNGFILGLRVDF